MQVLTLYDEVPDERYRGRKLIEVIDRNPYYVRERLSSGRLHLADCALRRLQESEAEWKEYEEFWKDRMYNL